MKKWIKNKIEPVETVLFYGTLIPAGVTLAFSFVSCAIAIEISLRAMDFCGESFQKINDFLEN